MLEKLSKKLTNDYKEVPLFYVTFDLKKYQESGEKGSCDLNLHPCLKDDPFIMAKLNDLVDHIRETYDMETFVK